MADAEKLNRFESNYFRYVKLVDRILRAGNVSPPDADRFLRHALAVADSPGRFHRLKFVLIPANGTGGPDTDHGVLYRSLINMLLIVEFSSPSVPFAETPNTVWTPSRPDPGATANFFRSKDVDEPLNDSVWVDLELDALVEIKNGWLKRMTLHQNTFPRAISDLAKVVGARISQLP